MIWENEFHAGLWNVSKYANDERALKNCYNSITKFFEDCNSYEDFYFRMKEYVIPAKYIGSMFFICDLKKLVEKVARGMERKKKIKLWCFQEAILMAAGMKARYSEWDEKLGKFITPYEFNFQFWVGRKERSHVELVIHKWKGKEINISMDTHLENKPHKWNGKARYLNSIMKTMQF